MHYDYLIVGSGLFGATFARYAADSGKTCLVIDKRPNIAGNVYTKNVEGINVHVYGAHIFHTSDDGVWEFVNRFAKFNGYVNRVIADFKGERYSLPFNMYTFEKLWGVTDPEAAKAKIAEQIAEFGIGEITNLEQQAISMVGVDVYRKLVKGYTEKQWGRPCTELPPSIIKRLPLRFTYDDNYFNDKYQGIPIGGYNKLVDGLLAGVECLTDTDFFNSTIPQTGKTLRSSWREVARKLVYTGALDEYFDFRLGRLDWRTVEFKTRVENTPNYQGNAVVNYTSHDRPYTRVIEHKHFEMFGQQVYDIPVSVVSEEYSTEYKEGMEPYYPVNDGRNNALADGYRRLAEKEHDVIFGGRLGQYKYYDMAPVIERAFKAFEESNRE